MTALQLCFDACRRSLKVVVIKNLKSLTDTASSHLYAIIKEKRFL